MNLQPLIFLGKIIQKTSRILGKGDGSTWPGHVVLSLEPHFIQTLLKHAKIKIIFVIGTNGKTTTSRMITTMLEKTNHTVIQNTSGANLQNGIASTLLSHATITGDIASEYAVFEVDENNLSLLLDDMTPEAIIVLNLFRDQLDRYGELDSIAKKWSLSFKKLPKSTKLILNADDPLIAYLGRELQATVGYFGVEHTTDGRKTLQHAADSIYCPRCHEKLTYSMITFSHLGTWHCTQCGLKRPQLTLKKTLSPLPGLYNEYNAAAAITLGELIGMSKGEAIQALKNLTPAFGRQEKIIHNGHAIQLFLSKNPTSFNESLHTIQSLNAKTILMVVNDRIPDGRDISWIWDIDFEEYTKGFDHIIVSGDRTYDIALRLQYADVSKAVMHYEPILEKALALAIEQTSEHETLYILPTYSAMLEVRKILTGRSIL